MTKKEFIKQVVKKTGFKQVECEKFFKACCETMQEQLIAGQEIFLPGIGKLKVKETAARKGRNPRSGEVLEVPAGRKVKLAVGKELKALM